MAYVFGSPLDNNREIRGTIPKNRKAFTIKAAVQHPEELLAKDFMSRLAEAGVFITGKIKFQKAETKKFSNHLYSGISSFDRYYKSIKP